MPLLFLLIIALGGFSDEEAKRILTLPTKDAQEILAEKEITLVDFSYDLATVHGRPLEALDFLDKSSPFLEPLEQEKAKLAKAWINYSMGNLDRALNETDLVLDSTNSKFIIARGRYLTGLVHYSWKDLEVSRTQLNMALEAYSELNKQGGMTQCLNMLIKIAIDQGNFDEAESLKAKVNGLDFDERRREIMAARKQFDQGIALFQSGDYTEVIEYCIAAREIFSKHKENLMKYWCDTVLSFSYAATGETKTANKLANEVENFARRSGNHRLRNYNRVSFLLIRKCKGYNTSTIKKKLEEYIASYNAQDISTLIDIAEKCKCP